MIWWTGLAPWELECSLPGRLISTFLDEWGNRARLQLGGKGNALKLLSKQKLQKFQVITERARERESERERERERARASHIETDGQCERERERARASERDRARESERAIHRQTNKGRQSETARESERAGARGLTVVTRPESRSCTGGKGSAIKIL